MIAASMFVRGLRYFQREVGKFKQEKLGNYRGAANGKF